MPRQASFDVPAFEQKILDAILRSPVEQSRREIFDRCGFDNENKALLSCFDRYLKNPAVELLVDKRGDRKHRTYIAKNPPIPTKPALSEVKPPSASETQGSPKPSQSQPRSSRLTSASEKFVRAKPPVPTFMVHEISEGSEVIDALSALSDASGAEKMVAVGVDKREPKKKRVLGRLSISPGYEHPVPLREIILAAGDVVYDFDISQILKSVYAISDNDNIRGFAPFRDFFANHTIVSHDTLSACAPLIALDIPPRAMQETRLAVRMLQYQAGVSGDDSLKASVLHYLKQIPYNASTAKIATVLPLFRELRERLGDKLTTYETYCAWLPRLASRQKPFALGLQHPDLLDNVDLPLCQQVHPTFEILGDGGIQLELSLCPTSNVKEPIKSPVRFIVSKRKQWWSKFSMIVTVRFGSKAQTHQILSVLSALESAQVVFRYNETVPERMAIFLMGTIKGFVDDAYIRLRLGNGCNDLGSGKAPVGWRDEWWDSWVDLASADVQSVLKS